MGNSNTTLRFVAVGVAVIAVAFCIGFFIIGGARTPLTAPSAIIAPTALPGAGTTPAPKRLASTGPRTQNGDYTAPGAPNIHIVEERTPSLTDTSRQQPTPAAPPPPTTPPDSEASQEAAPKPKTAAVVTAVAPPNANTGDTGQTNTPPNANTPPNPPNMTPATPDTTPSTSSGHSDSESGQDGTQALFRVQTGSFEAAKNARALADALRDRGYVTSVRTEMSGNKAMYKVQIGAYRTRAAADKAAQDLQSNGYPAYVSAM